MENQLIILAQNYLYKNQEQLAAIKQCYNAKYQGDLEDNIKKKLIELLNNLQFIYYKVKGFTSF